MRWDQFNEDKGQEENRKEGKKHLLYIPSVGRCRRRRRRLTQG